MVNRPQTLADLTKPMPVPTWRDVFAVLVFAVAFVGMVEAPWIVSWVERVL